MNRLLSTLLVVGWVGSPLLLTTMVRADEKKIDKDLPAKVSKNQEGVSHHAYLGVAVATLHPGLVAHLPESLIDGQGVLVNSVAKDSPAEKAGLKSHDILVRYDDQKLFSPEQLTKLVWADQPGRKVTLGAVHEGELMEAKATLGESPKMQPQSRPVRPRTGWHWPRGEDFRSLMPDQKRLNWNSFDSLTLQKLDEDRFRAEIGYLDEDGKTQHQVFEGTREEIRHDILSQKEMPANERDHLLHSLDMRRQEIRLPHLEYGPGWEFEFQKGVPSRPDRP